MCFYSIKTAVEKKLIGTLYPQIQTMDGTVNRNAPDSLYNVYPNEFPEFTPNLNYFVLNNDAKLTDVLSAAMISYGFIVNDKIKNILEKFKLPPFKFYPATVNYKKTYYKNYYWFFYVCDMLDFIDYTKTKFYITDMADNKIEDCSNMSSKKLLRSLQDVLPNDRDINTDLLFLNKSILNYYDLIKIPFGNYRSYCSKSLSDELTANIIGFSFTETKNILLC